MSYVIYRGDMNNTIVKDEVKIENLIENLGILVDRALKK